MTCTAEPLAVEILDERSFDALAPEWEALLDRSYDNRIFLTPTWYSVWWGRFGSGTASVLTSRDPEGLLQAVLPLQVALDGNDRRLSLVGDHEVADYMDGAAVRAEAVPLLARLWECALSELPWSHVELRHVPSSSPLIPALVEVASQRKLKMQIEGDEVCPVALLCSTWDGYLQMLTKKQRHEIRRKMRRAQEGADWVWRTVSPSDPLEPSLEAFFRLHTSATGEKAGFMTRAIRGFFCDLAEAYLRRGNLRLSFFERNGDVVAATFSFFHRQRYFLYNSAYAPRQAGYSPGVVAVAHAMEHAIAEKAVAFDFLSGVEPYKYQFGATDTFTCRVSVTR